MKIFTRYDMSNGETLEDAELVSDAIEEAIGKIKRNKSLVVNRMLNEIVVYNIPVECEEYLWINKL
jgi:hypothetical protein